MRKSSFKIVMVISVIAILIFLVFILNKDSKKGNYDESKNFTEPSLADTELESILEECKMMYLNSKLQNFEVYFSIDYINNHSENSEISLVKNLEDIDFEWVKIYDINGKQIEKFPKILSDGTSLQYEKDTSVIEPNKIFLIKNYMYKNSCSYYHLISISKSGSVTLKPVCYTIGEFYDNTNIIHDI